MDFDELLALVGDDPLFETELLLAPGSEPPALHRQLALWVEEGKILQLRLGLYTLAPPHQRQRPHPFVIANHLVKGSYVSLRSALAFYGLLPADLPSTTSVASTRPSRWHTPLGSHEFRHLRGELMTGFCWVSLPEEQEACVASPEKALLDFIYLEPGSDSPAALRRLSPERLRSLDLRELRRQAEIAGRDKLRRAAERIAGLAERGPRG